MEKNYTGIFTRSSVLDLGPVKKQLDINQDPNNPSTDQATTPLLFPAAEISAASAIGGELAIIGMLVVRIYDAGRFFFAIPEFRFIQCSQYRFEYRL